MTVVVLAAGAYLGGAGLWAADSDSFICFPTCSEVDGKMLTMAVDFGTLTGQEIGVTMRSAPGEEALQIGVFDGDAAGFWDVATAPNIKFELFRDADGDGTGRLSPANLVGTWSTSPSSAFAAPFPDNAWANLPLIDNATHGVLPTGCSSDCPYSYFLLITLEPTPGANAVNNFKVRTNGTMGLKSQTFGFYAPPPFNFPGGAAQSNVTNDGKWLFGFETKQAGSSISIWDGDFDYGDYQCLSLDTDDLNTSPFELLPFSSPAAVAEGVGVGVNQSATACPTNPAAVGMGNPNDNSITPARRRNPDVGLGLNVIYRLFTPAGDVFLNANPSGNMEWEHFRVSTDPYDANTMDHHAESLPAGVYSVEAQGVDIGNLNFWYFSYDLLGLPPNGPPACSDCFYTIERYVWHDTDRDGAFDSTEQGIPGVVIERIDASTGAKQYATTGTDGSFTFRVAAGDYTLEVLDTNFNAGQPLNGLYFTGNNGQGTHTGEFAEVPGMGSSKPYDRRDFGYVANTPPTANDDLGACACSSANGTVIDVLANDADIDNQTLSVVSVTQPGFGTVTLNANNTVTYVPNAGYIGADSFTYTVEDGHGGSATGIARVDVLNNPPTLTDDVVAGIYGQSVSINVLANDSNPSGGTLAVTSVTQGQFGTVSINGDGTLSYTPNGLTFVGEDEFTYMVVTECGEATARVRITVPPPPPTCDPGGFTTYTPGGWGAKPSGNNPGMLLSRNFSTVYPGGSVTIGSGTKVLTFTSAKAIEVFLPLGGNPGVLNGSATNPKTSVGGPFIGHLLSLQLAADFSRAGVLKSGLGNMAMLSGPLAGQTVNQILALANGVAGGTAALPSGVTLTSLQDTLVAIIMNYHEGTVDGGLLGCGGGTPPPPPPPPPPVDPPPATGSGVCSGGVTKLVLKYIGSGSPSGVVSAQRSAPGNGPIVAAQVSGNTYTFATTEMGGLFDSVSGGRLANNLSVFVGTTKVADVHTSCSVPIFPGMKVGNDFEIVALWTRGAGLY